MSSRRKIIFITAVILQAVILFSMIAKQELLLKNGTKVMLKCIPVDPRSLFSGDYVRLNYGISEIRKGETEAEHKKFDEFSEGDTIYVALVK
ncbi:MAG TPA: GDYXXLXY domain-containing protein, partial [Spirochaetota bacterium]|nr:GDYXXLXY domain-containing protein [Spirochaetota bacterium]